MFRLFPALVLLAGCGGTTQLGPDPIRPDPPDDPLEDFFGLTIHEVAIELDEDDVADLLDEPYEYVDASVTIDGTRLESVGVRQKGHAGSFVPIDADEPVDWRAPKPAFLIDFDRYVDGQRFAGLEKLALNNLVQDPTGFHEFLAYALFREGGAPASRTGWATLELSGRDKGIYALVESVDNSVFLERWYGTDEGNLYEGEYGTDLRSDHVEWFEQDHGEDTTREDLEELAEALDAVDEGDDPIDVLEAYFDLDAYLTFSTTELALGHWDGYAWSINNYRLHHHPETGVWTFLPWGMDQTFDDMLWPHAGVMQGPGPSWKWGGRVHQVCLQAPECRDALHDAWEATLDRMDELDLVGLAGQARELVEEPVLADAELWGEPDWALEMMDGAVDFIQERPEQVRQWLPCLTGGEVDIDGDGWDGCSEDCDDHAAEINPGAPEQCNFVDDDCNGVLDDPPECPSCQDGVGADGVPFSLCVEWLSWSDARQYCLDRGQDLASIHDPETWERISWGLVELAGIWEAWIGLNDLGQEGTFGWSDGSDLDFAPWVEDDAMLWGDCAINSLWGWWASDCDEELPFVCR